MTDRFIRPEVAALYRRGEVSLRALAIILQMGEETLRRALDLPQREEDFADFEPDPAHTWPLTPASPPDILSLGNGNGITFSSMRYLSSESPASIGFVPNMMYDAGPQSMADTGTTWTRKPERAEADACAYRYDPPGLWTQLQTRHGVHIADRSASATSTTPPDDADEPFIVDGDK